MVGMVTAKRKIGIRVVTNPWKMLKLTVKRAAVKMHLQCYNRVNGRLSAY